MKSWKTTAGGIGGVLGALGDILHGLSTGTAINWGADIPIIITAIGLIFAKDHDVSGTTSGCNAKDTKPSTGARGVGQSISS
jgi:hypothetical protein